jgi:tetratricopeptide (TPR) repeat protein
VPENRRIEELRRRVQKDPSSIAFAQLGEEYRRAGHHAEAVETCRTGLQRHPGYLSARVTLGRALIETGDLAAAEGELAYVLEAAPENLAALRGIADVHDRRGDLETALTFYRRALALAQNDPDLEQTVADVERAIGAGREPAEAPGGLSFDQARDEFNSLVAELEAAGAADRQPAGGTPDAPAEGAAGAAPDATGAAETKRPPEALDETDLEALLDAIEARRRDSDS